MHTTETADQGSKREAAPSLILGMMRLLDYPELTAPASLAHWINGRLDEGLNVFDHADIYGDSRCESLFGEALKADPTLGPRLRIITKTDIVHAHQDSSPWGVKHYYAEAEYIRTAIDAALIRLNIDCIDTFLIHRPDPLADMARVARALEGAVQAGKVRHIGVSNFLPEQWRWLQDNTDLPLACNQSELSLIANGALFDGTHEAHLRDSLLWLAWSPLGGGLLEKGVLGQALARAREETGLSTTALAIAWLRTIPGAPVPVLGSLREERIQQALAGAEMTLSRELWYSLLEAARGYPVA